MRGPVDFFTVLIVSGDASGVNRYSRNFQKNIRAIGLLVGLGRGLRCAARLIAKPPRPCLTVGAEYRIR